MTDDNKQSIRQQAETVLNARNAQSPQGLRSLSFEEIQNMVHELEVHQIQLEMQNEELQRTHLELNTTKKRYFNLYDMAPVGYCTVGKDGLIQESNLAISNLLGIERDKLLKRPITRFILNEDQDIYYKYRHPS